MPDEYDALLDSLAPPKRRTTHSRLNDLISFAQEHKLKVGSTTGGRHNVGSKHYSGNAIDIKGSGAFDDSLVNRLKQSALERGFILRDERRRPPKQKVWGGPHIHIEAGDDYDALLGEVKAQSPDPYDQLLNEIQGQTPPAESINTTPRPPVSATKPTRQTSVPVSTRFGVQRDKRYSRPLRAKPQEPEIIDAGPEYSQPSGLITREPSMPAMQARTPGIIERVTEAVKPYVPGLTSLDTPAGIKVDSPRGVLRGVTLGAVGESRPITREALLVDPDAEAKRNLAEGVGETLGAVVPYVGASKGLSVIPALSKATRAAHIARTGATFGGVEAVREGIQAAKTGEPISPENIGVSTAIGTAMGGIAGVSPSMKRQVVAFLTPGIVADVARGTPMEQAIQNGLTNLGFALTSGARGRAPREAELQSRMRGPTVPVETQERLSRVPERIEDARQGETQRQGVSQEQSNMGLRKTPLVEGRTASSEAEARTPSTGIDLKQSQRFAHKDFGQVTEAENQSGVPKGSVRVVDESGAEHTILKPKGTGAGNIRAIPIKQAGKELVTPPVESRKVENPAIAGENQYGDAVDVGSSWHKLRDAPPEQKLALYHATSRERAEAIMREGYKATRGAFSNTPEDYVYMGSKSGLGTYEGLQGGKNPVYVVFGVRKANIEADKGSDWKSALRNPNVKRDVKSFGGDPNNPTAVDTFLHIGQVRAHKSAVEPIGIIDAKTGEFIPRSSFGQPSTPSVSEGARLPDRGMIARSELKELRIPTEGKVKDATQEAVLEPEAKTVPREGAEATAAPLIRRSPSGHAALDPSRQTLSQAVRATGGIRIDIDKANKGELARLSNRETGTSGLVNQRGTYNAEQMALRMAEEGYRGDWVEITRGPHGPKYDVDGNKFLEAVEADQRGIKKSFSGEQDWDYEAEYRKAFPEETASYDNLISLMESGDAGKIYDKVINGQAKRSDIQAFRRAAQEYGVGEVDIAHTIAEGERARSSQAALGPDIIERSSSPEFTPLESLRARGRAGEAGYATVTAGRRPTAPILAEVERATQTTEKRPSIASRIAAIPSRVQTALTSQFTPLRRLEAELYGNKKVPVVDLARKFEQVAGAPAKAEADVIEFRRAVVDPIKNQADDFNSYLFLQRVKDRLAKDPDRKRVADWTPEKADAGLSELRAKVGSETMKQFDRLGKTYQGEMRKALQLQVESGRMSKELYDRIVNENDFYAPFKVLKYIEENEGIHGTGRPIATTQQLSKKITGIDSTDFQLGNILQASAEQIVKSRILAEKNFKMLELDKLADYDPSGNLIARVDADARPRQGYETVRFFKDGKPVALEVQKPVAQAIQGLNAGEASLIAKALALTKKPLQWGATSANAPFQVVNLFFADLPRAALVSRYGVRSPRDIYQFPLDWTYSLFTSMKGNFGKPNPLFMDWLKSGAANSTIQRELTPESFKPPPIGMVGRRPAKAVLDSVAKFSNAIEETSKILGLRRGMRIERVAGLPPVERKAAMDKIVTEVRNYSGSPDFARKGTQTQDLNLLFMFFNARLQGLSSDAARLAGKTGKPEAAAAWARLGAVIGIPTTVLAIINNLPQYKDDYEKVPDWERQTYWMIPRESYFVNEDTDERVRDYWRIPKRELGKLFANTIESAVRFGMERDPETAQEWAVGMVENISPVNIEGRTSKERFESFLGGTNPILKVPTEIATNRDLFRHRAIVPQYMEKAEPTEQYRASTPQSFVRAGKALRTSPLMLEHVAQGVTGGGVGQFTLREPQPGRSALVRYPLLRRFVRSGATSEDSGLGERVSQAERAQATEQVVRRRKAMQMLATWKGLSDSEVERQIATIDDKQLAEKVKDIRKEMQRGLTYMDKRIATLGVESGARERFIQSETARMSPEEKELYLAELHRKGLLPLIGRQRTPRSVRRERVSPK